MDDKVYTKYWAATPNHIFKLSRGNRTSCNKILTTSMCLVITISTSFDRNFDGLTLQSHCN